MNNRASIAYAQEPDWSDVCVPPTAEVRDAWLRGDFEHRCFVRRLSYLGCLGDGDVNPALVAVVDELPCWARCLWMPERSREVWERFCPEPRWVGMYD